MTSQSHQNGDMADTVLINGFEYNSTTLSHWNYTYYPTNGTLSNTSRCYLIFDTYHPILLNNGTFLNCRSCYSPINPLQARGSLGLVYGSLFAFMILFATINLRRHGRSYLSRERGGSQRLTGRRWTWYWMIFVAACGVISCFAGVDVDRDYVLGGLPIVLQGFFYTLMIPGSFACVWEAIRAWGAAQLRIIRDDDPFAFPNNDDRRARVEFYLPLIFYAFDWMVFFMTIPRSWTPLQQQRSVEQTMRVARPTMTDVRFKIGGIFASCCWILVCYNVQRITSHYRPKVSTLLILTINALGALAGYVVATGWIWSISPYWKDVSLGWLYGLGYGSHLSILIFLNFRGYLSGNDDQIIMTHRFTRGEGLNRQLAASTSSSRRPTWWSSSHYPRSSASGIRGTHRMHQNLELRPLPHHRTHSKNEDDESGTWWWQSLRKGQKQDDEGSEEKLRKDSAKTRGSSMLLQNEPLPKSRGGRHASPARSAQSGTSALSLQSRPQVVRSMLDV